MEIKTITIMTIIELLNKISKNETVPKQVKYRNTIYTFKKEDRTYYDENYETLLSMYNFGILNDTVEILLEENDEWEDIEEIKLIQDSIEFYDDEKTRHFMNTNRKDRDIYIKKINSLIKNQKYLKEKLESKNE